jgi:hypothetical protein
MVLVSLGLKASPLAVGFGRRKKRRVESGKGCKEKKGPENTDPKKLLFLPPPPFRPN